MKVDKNNEYLIGVLGPRYQGNYGLILPAVMKAIDRVKYEAERDLKNFVFIHDGVSSGSTGEVIAAVNIIRRSLSSGYDIHIGHRKKALDIEMHGKQSHYRWAEELIDLKPDLLLLIDNGEWHQVQYANKLAEQNSIPIAVVNIKPEPEEQ
ncbi:hypothetical protein SEA_NICEHOUSE_211 [Rhodococcus phage NiceHouse]|nr:hypothetical protein SEA_NICEHOUSE_211 [Rhodococcus phage NiceHouse]